MKEIDVELPDDADREKMMKEVEDRTRRGRVLWLTDRRGRRVGVPAVANRLRRVRYIRRAIASSDSATA